MLKKFASGFVHLVSSVDLVCPIDLVWFIWLL